MNNFSMFRLWIALSIFVFSTSTVIGQSLEKIARQHLQQQSMTWQVLPEDIRDLELDHQFQTEHNRVWHLYFQQKFNDIPIRNALANIAIKDDKVVFASHNLVSNAASKVSTSIAVLPFEEAVFSAIQYLQIDGAEFPRFINAENGQQQIFSGGDFSRKDIPVYLVYHIDSNDRLVLTYEITIHQKEKDDYRTLYVNAITGVVEHEFSRLLHCNFGKGGFLQAHHDCSIHQSKSVTSQESTALLTDDARYLVWELPLESPADDGDRTLKLNPHDPIASPFGWHDVDGDDEIDYEITRGNNTHAYIDGNDNNQSSGNEPNGGSELTFAPGFNTDWEPQQYQEQSVVQLFYSTNMMHDIAYRLGFDEAAGNYQETNFTGEGQGGDYVFAEAQNNGTNTTNNANFSIEPDGQNGRMQLFLWNQQGLLTVDEPTSLSGIYETRDAEFGPNITDVPISGEVVIVDDGSALPTQGCNPLQNADDIEGKIAMVDRGTCDYSQKVLNAQNAGAIGCIVCNFDGGSFNPMGVGNVGGQVDIPAVLIQYNDCQTLRQFAGTGLVVSLVEPSNDGPQYLDGALDNATVAHEYAHGISVRLTGGANQAFCLNNDEQMGEGWSDFFALAVTAKADQNGTEARGMSTYSLGQETEGAGARRFPYSTDFDINSQTYFDIIGGVRPHPVGEVWSAILWDLHWAMVAEYGFDEDLFEGISGNNIALQLVMDGMKLQSCSPGFVDGRDAILMADQMNNNGDNQCLIWEVFARRGVGFGAEQRSANNRNDGSESYDLLPSCIKELKIEKAVTELIEPGENIEVSITIRNHKDETISGVVVTDIVPEGTTYVAGSSNISNISLDGNELTFELNGDMTPGETRIVLYQLASDPALGSTTYYIDDMETNIDDWDLEVLKGSSLWSISNAQSVSGSQSWYAEATEVESDFILVQKEPIDLPNDMEFPVLRFQHWFDTEWGFDGGIIQISTDDGNTWENVSEEMFRNGYETVLSFFAFNVVKMPAFAGEGDSFRETYIDLSDYIGEEVLFRFRFATDEESSNENGVGWYIDDVEIIDAQQYDSEACVSSNEGDFACATGEGRGTIVQPNLSVSTNENLVIPTLHLYPNPVRKILQLNITTPKPTSFSGTIIGMDGKVMDSQQFDVYNQTLLQWSVSGIPAGIYAVRLESEEAVIARKVVIID